jgi:RHS repeat-associated protein
MFKKILLTSLILIAFGTSVASAVPGRRNIHAEPVKPDEARKILEGRGGSPIQTESFGAPVGTGVRITELARGLKNDPNLIYKYVQDNIGYTPIYGCIKGPEMTLLDGVGNDFDQASLLVALFRQAGFTANYVYGTIRLNSSQITNWLGTANNPDVVGMLLGSAGIPAQIWVDQYSNLLYVDLDHVWVKVNISGTNYVFDPSFKNYSSTGGINLQSAMGYDPNVFLARTSSGATIQPDYVQNINKPNLTSDFNSYSTNLINYIKTNSPAATLQQIIGGRTVVPAATVPRQTLLSYQQSITYEWTDIPVAYKVSLRIQHCGIDTTVYSDQIYGKRLTIFYNTSNQPMLSLDGQVLATGYSTTPGTTQDVTLTVNHPYAANGGTYCDDSRTLYITAGGSYLIVNGWASTGTKAIEEHRKILKQNRHAGGSDTSEPVLGESLAMMGFTWLAECSRASQISDQIANTATIDHHTLGICGQYDAPYIDMPMCSCSVTSRAGDQSKEQASFFVSSGQSSAFEWGVVEQLQPPHSAVSTVKLVDIANGRTYNKIFDATSSNYYSTIRSQLHNYNSYELSDVDAYINAGYRVILPQDGDLGEGKWSGIGFLAVSPGEDQIAHIISGGLNGGFGTDDWYLSGIDTWYYDDWVYDTTSSEPIDLVTGDYLYEKTDLTIGGGSYPVSIDFKRSYSSGASLDNGPLGLGWKHNLGVSATVSSDGFQGLGADSPIDAASSIVESYVSIDLLSSTKTNLRLTVATMAHRWFMDHLMHNVVTIDQPGNSMQFVKLPDGNYNPQPGEAAKLTLQPDGSYLLRTKHGEYLDFDVNGRITSWNDPNNTVNYTYSINGKLSQVNNGLGRSLNLIYDLNDANHIASVTDSTGRAVHFGYDAKGDLTTFTDANGFMTTFAYDPNNDGQITRIYYPTEPNNPFVTNVYDSLGQVKTQTNANGFTYQYFYSGYRTEEADPCNYSNVYTFNDYGRLLTQADPLGNQTTYQYDGQLRKTVVTQPRGNATRYIYDTNNNVLQSIQVPVAGSGEPNIVESFTYEPNFNRVATYTDPNGRTATFQYYSNGKLREIDQPAIDGNIPRTLFTYNSHGQTETVTNQDGMVTKYQYDTSGNLISTVVDYGVEPNKLNITASMTYNATGDANSINDPRSNKTTFEYDAMRRLVKATAPAPFNYITSYEYYHDGSLKQLRRQTSDPEQWQVTSYTYTPSGKIETVTDPNGYTTQYQYDALDRLMKSTDAENHTTTRLYDAAGRLWKVIDANDNNSVVYTYNANGSIDTLKDAKGNTTTYQYDGHNRLKKTIYPNSTFEQLTYDITGNISQKQNRGGQTIGYAYDPLNRLKTKTLPGPQQIQYAYDLTGRLKAVTDSTGTIQHIYDRIGRLVGVTYPDGKNVSYQYDTGSNRQRLTYPDSSYVTYDYDSLSRLTYIRDDDGSMVAHYDYDALSRRTGAQFANGTSTAYLYNIANRLLTLNNQMTSSSRSFAYTYDKVGNRLTMTTDGVAQHRYSYDKIYQLTGADYPAGFFAADTNFNYDKAGNRSSVITGGTTNYAANNLNQYTAVGGITYSYDSNGNLTYDGNNTYTYDAENRLMTANRTSVSVSYQYDPFGRRISKNVNGTITKYVYDGDQIICEYNGSGKLVRKFLYGTGIDEPVRMTNVLLSADLTHSGFVDFADLAVLARVWRLDANSPVFDPNADLVADNVINLQDLEALADSWLTDGKRGEDYYYHYDGLGSVIALTDSAGHLTENYAYDVYGRANTTSSISNPYLFTGRQFDGETGLYYYRARYYSPAIGRFLQTDPVGYKDSTNLYAYVFNNPINFIDPMGLWKDEPDTFLDNLWNGYYFGTGYGQEALDWWAQKYVESDTWYGKVGYCTGGLFAALWTPDTWKQTTLTLVGAYYLSGVQGTIAIHGAHHSFDGVLLRHLQIIIWREGVAGSHWILRIPLWW